MVQISMVTVGLMTVILVYMGNAASAQKTEGQWLSTPGTVRACAHSDVVLNWTYNTASVPRPSVIWWFELDTMNTVLKYTLDSGESTIFHPEYQGRVYMLPDSNAGLVVLNVGKSDEKQYRVEMPGLSDIAELFVYSEPELLPSVLVDGTNIEINASIIKPKRKNITILVETQQELPANILIYIRKVLQEDVTLVQTCNNLMACNISFNLETDNWLIYSSVDYEFCQNQLFNLTIITKPEVETMMTVDINGDRIQPGHHWYLYSNSTDNILTVNTTSNLITDINIIFDPGGISFLKRCLRTTTCSYIIDYNKVTMEQKTKNIPVEVTFLETSCNQLNFTFYLTFLTVPTQGAIGAVVVSKSNKSMKIVLGVTCSLLPILIAAVAVLLWLVIRLRHTYGNQNLSVNTEHTTLNTSSSFQLDKTRSYEPMLSHLDDGNSERVSSPSSHSPKKITITVSEVKKTHLGNRNSYRESSRATLL